MEPLTPSPFNITQNSMRGVGGFCVADSSSAWVKVVDNLAENVLAAEGRRLFRRLKAGAFRVLRHPIWLRVLPRTSPQVPLDVPADLIIKGKNDKWIAFDLQGGRVIRKLASRELYQQEVWIRTIPEVAAISPPILKWDPDGLMYVEAYQPGRPAALHDLDEGMKVLLSLWPRLAAVYKVKTSCAPLDLPKLDQDLALQYVVREGGLEAAWQRLEGHAVKQGLLHGDLKHLNILVQKDKLWVIDWGEQFFTGPPLFDLLYFLYWHTRSFPPEIVINRALASPGWISDSLPEGLEPLAVEASLLVFALEMVKRIGEEGSRKSPLKKLVRFLKAATGRLRELSVNSMEGALWR
ncbi:MAG: phosphotransferase [Firmicutes bacterium]|nr:phosphotransferase [Bacillota bacterium]